jgi:hypothetical protein
MRARAASLLALTLSLGSVAAHAAEPISFSRDIVPVLKTHCAVCHLTGQEAGQLALHPRAAYDNLVNVKSVGAPLRVAPGKPKQSYLLAKIEGTHLDVGGSGRRMPFDGEFLDKKTVRMIKQWIADGAKRN